MARRGVRESVERVGVSEEGDCPRCGGETDTSSMTGYLSCLRCGYEFADPSHVSARGTPSRRSIDDDSQDLDRFRQELSQGEWKSVLGVNQDISSEQAASLKRLQSKWMDGMKGHFNVASEERKPLMIAFDDDDNVEDTVVGSVTLLTNDFDGGEEVRLEYPGIGTEFYHLEEDSPQGWRRGVSTEDTARSIAFIINKHSKLVYSHSVGPQILFELRDESLDVDSLVIFVDDPGGQDMVAEKGGVSLDPRDVHRLDDFKTAVEIVLADGVITPSEDQLLYAMRDQLGISDQDYIRIVVGLFGEDVLKECYNCGGGAQLFTEHLAWYCDGCQTWT